MNDSQIRAINKHLKELQEGVDADALINHIYARNGFNYNKQEELSSYSGSGVRAREFFKAIKKIENGWELLEEGLNDAKQSWLWKKLFNWEQEARREIEQETLDKKLKDRSKSNQSDKTASEQSAIKDGHADEQEESRLPAENDD